MTVQQLIEILVGIFAVGIMLNVGLDLTVERIRAVWAHPRVMSIALVVNHLITPMIALAVVRLLNFPTDMANGVLLCSCAAGGPVGAYIVQQSRGNLPVGASLMFVSNVVNLALTPLTMKLFTQAAGGGAPGLSMALTVFFFMLLPLASGVGVRHRFEPFALQWLPRLKMATNILMALVVACVVTVNGDGLEVFTAVHVAAIAALAATPFLLGGLSVPGGARTAVSIVSGCRNVTTVFLLATAWFPAPVTQLTALVYTGFMYVVALSIAARVRFGYSAKLL